MRNALKSQFLTEAQALQQLLNDPDFLLTVESCNARLHELTAFQLGILSTGVPLELSRRNDALQTELAEIKSALDKSATAQN